MYSKAYVSKAKVRDQTRARENQWELVTFIS